MKANITSVQPYIVPDIIGKFICKQVYVICSKTEYVKACFVQYDIVTKFIH